MKAPKVISSDPGRTEAYRGGIKARVTRWAKQVAKQAVEQVAEQNNTSVSPQKIRELATKVTQTVLGK